MIFLDCATLTMNNLIKNLLPIDEKIIVCEENLKKVRLTTNNKKFYKIHLDNDDLVPNKQMRCDYIIVCEDLRNIAIWIELKGSDIARACNQIKASIEKYGTNVKNKYAVIVFSSKTSPKTNTHFQRFQKKFRKNLFYKSDLVEIKYDRNLDKIVQTN